jgi:hypothetical protein
MAEVRNLMEGTLYWVQGSGSGKTWATASAPTSGLFGFVQSMNYSSAQRLVAVSNRGIPDHWKQVGKDPISISVTFAWTGSTPTAISGASASVPFWHLEYKADMPEAASTATYFQFIGVPVQSLQWTEGDQDTVQFTMQALAMVGPTASGYIVAA